MKVRRQFVRREAESLRNRFFPEILPVPVEELAQKLGFKIKRKFDDSSISGFLVRNGSDVVIGVNPTQSPLRQRFTIAHEIGHALLHQQENVYIDKRFRSSLSSEGVDVDEKEANLFAAELLMPSLNLKNDLLQGSALDLEEDERIVELAKSYQVSRQAMNNRLNYLGYLGL